MVISFFFSYLGILASAALLFGSQIALGISIKRDATALGITSGTAFMVLTILFGGIPAAIYLAVRADIAKDMDVAAISNAPKSAKTSIVLYIISLVVALLCVWSMLNSLNGVLDFIFNNEELMEAFTHSM